MKKSNMVRKLFSLILIVAMVFSVMAVGAFSASAAEADIVAQGAKTRTLYFSTGGYWSNLFCVYAWTGDNKDAGDWETLTKVPSEDDLYCVSLDAEYTNVIFASRFIPAFTWDAVDNKTDDLVIPDGCNYLTLTGPASSMWGNYVAEDTDMPSETQSVYFAPTTEWTEIQSNLYHEFAVRAWNNTNTDGYWAQLELVEGAYGGEGSVFSADVPADCNYVEFCRIEGTIESGVWSVWEKTDEQTIPSSSNLFTQNNDIETGVWSYYEAPDTPPTEEPDEPDSTTSTPSDPVTPVDTRAVYFTANEDWQFYTSEMAGISVYSWTTDENSGTWTWAEAVEDKDGLYVAQIPADDFNIYFGLCYGASPDVVWAQTENQSIPDDCNHFVQDEIGDSGNWNYYAGGNTSAGKYYSVVFVNDDNTLLKAQIVAEGTAAIAPVAPSKEADEQYTYTFSGWDTSFSNVTSDIIVKAVYSATVREYTVTFIGNDDSVIFAQSVPYGGTVEAPEAPTVEGYNFIGWDTDFDVVTKDITVKALYKKISMPVTTGKLRIEISGGNSFTINVNGTGARPQGASYVNTKMPIGASVTVVAQTIDGVEFLGWMNESGAVESQTDTYTFVTTGNDYLKAVYKTVVTGVNTVIFKNSRAADGRGQIIDMQYYAAGDEILFPANASLAGYDFAGWNLTAEQIEEKLSAGEDVIVDANFTRSLVYIDITVNGGKAVTAPQPNGKYLAYGGFEVKANTAPAGQKFSHWADATGKIMSYDETYKSYPAESMELTAVFVASNAVIDKKPLAFLAGDPTIDGEKITYTMSWDIDPSIGTVTSAGLVVVDKNDYNAETFWHGSGDSKIFDRALGSSAIKAKNTTSINLSSRFYDHTYYAATFVTYTDAKSGESVTIYSDMIETLKPAP